MLMNIGDKITWGYRLLFIMMLIWLRFVEPYLSIWYLWLVWGIVIYIWFFQPFKKKPKTQPSETISAG
jgi:hypothetical protein